MFGAQLQSGVRGRIPSSVGATPPSRPQGAKTTLWRVNHRSRPQGANTTLWRVHQTGSLRRPTTQPRTGLNHESLTKPSRRPMQNLKPTPRGHMVSFETRTGKTPVRSGTFFSRNGNFPFRNGNFPVRGSGKISVPEREREISFPFRTEEREIHFPVRNGKNPFLNRNMPLHSNELLNEVTQFIRSLISHRLSLTGRLTVISPSVMDRDIESPLLPRVVVGLCYCLLNSITTAIKLTPLTMVNAPRGSLAMARPATALGLLSPPGTREVLEVTFTIRSLIHRDNAESADSPQQNCWDIMGASGPTMFLARIPRSSHWCRDQDFSEEQQSEKEGSAEIPPRLAQSIPLLTKYEIPRSSWMIK